MTTIDYRINGARVGGTYLNMFRLRKGATDRKAKLPRGNLSGDGEKSFLN